MCELQRATLDASARKAASPTGVNCHMRKATVEETSIMKLLLKAMNKAIENKEPLASWYEQNAKIL